MVAQEAKQRGFRKLGITGTKWLVDSEVYPNHLSKEGIEWVRPSEEDREELGQIIMCKLVRGIFRPESIGSFQRFIAEFQDQGCDGVYWSFVKTFFRKVDSAVMERAKLIICRGSIQRLNDWTFLRQCLWPHTRLDHHEGEVEKLLSLPDRVAGYLALVDDIVVGFAEAALRSDYVNGCEGSPVLFLEGIYVQPAWRRFGIARQLCRAIETWGKKCGCLEFASDTSIASLDAQLLHQALGFKETERVVFYRKLIETLP